MRSKNMRNTYFVELGAAILVYAVVLVLTIKYGRPMEAGTLRTIVLLSPMVGFVLAGWAIQRHFKRTDEYFRKNSLEAGAIAAAATAAITFSYGFLETAGYPKLSMFVIWPLMCVIFALVSCIQAWRNR
jgi:hypothetical protein